MLKEFSPRLSRIAFIANPKTTAYDFFLRSPNALAPSLAIAIAPSPVATAADIERVIAAFARVPDGGLFLPPDSTSIAHRDLIIELAARHRLPAIYAGSFFVTAGGLVSYAVDRPDTFRLAASYVDRILRDDKPPELPVQAPIKHKTAINLTTAKELGLTVPPALLIAADEVIE